MLIVKVQLVDIKTVIPYARNPRKNQEAVSKVAASIKEFGFKQPIVVDAENVVIAGHTRLMAAQQLEIKKVPVVVADDLTEAQVKAYRIADNRVSQEAEWDYDLLKLEIDDLVGVNSWAIEEARIRNDISRQERRTDRPRRNTRSR